jgi:hypothetical protein
VCVCVCVCECGGGGGVRVCGGGGGVGGGGVRRAYDARTIDAPTSPRVHLVAVARGHCESRAASYQCYVRGS